MSNISFENQQSCQKYGKQLKFIKSYDEMNKYIIKNLDTNLDTNLNKNLNIITPPLSIDHLNEISRLNFYNNLSATSIENTFNYMFFKIRLGIFVEIKDNKLSNFIPFVNPDYKNEWKNQIYFPKGVTDYHKYRSKILNRYERLEDLDKWSSNNCLIGNWINSDNIVGDMGWNELYEMLNELCKNRKINDITFFINRRDHPAITRKLEEPYFHIWDSMEKELVSHKYNSYAPIFSYCSSSHFADLMLPTYACWREITQKYYPTSCSNLNKDEIVSDWDKKKATAIFRGSATGCGIDTSTNQRLKIAELSHLWKFNNKYNKNNKVDGIPYLDAGVVGWNKRDKKFINKPVNIINVKKLKFRKVDYISMNQQTSHKYIIHIDGHVAAYRLSKELSFGSVILKVESLYDYQLWFTSLLKPWIHYIPVKKDLSDLDKMITWCKNNDSKCKSIAENAKIFYKKYINRDYIYDYLETSLINMSYKYVKHNNEINSDYKKPIQLNYQVKKIELEEHMKYYSYYDENKHIFKNNNEYLNLYGKINEYCNIKSNDYRYYFFKEHLNKINTVKTVNIITNLESTNQLDDNNGIAEAVVTRFGNKIKINLFLIPKLENNIIIKKIKRNFIKDGEIKIDNFPPKDQPVDLILIDYDNIYSNIKLIEREEKHLSIFNKIIDYINTNLKINGTIIFKIYDFNNEETKNIIYKLDKLFNKIIIDKNMVFNQYDNTKYLICYQYAPKENNSSVTNLDNLNNTFIDYQIGNIKRIKEIMNHNNIDNIKIELSSFINKYSKEYCKKNEN